jgi:hypothetical protein
VKENISNMMPKPRQGKLRSVFNVLVGLCLSNNNA